MTSAESATSRFHPLTARQCEDLLATQRAGRVPWNAADGPRALPVTYRMYTGEVVLRTSPYGALSQLVEPTNVAFEIDEVDQESGVGWSVVVRGRAQAVTHADDLAKLWVMDGLAPWATGTQNLFVGITPHSISGRAVKDTSPNRAWRKNNDRGRSGPQLPTDPRPDGLNPEEEACGSGYL